MNRLFKKYEDLIDFIKVERCYAEQELSNYLGCVESDISSFKLEVDNKIYEIYVKTEEIAEDEYKYSYILIDVIDNKKEYIIKPIYEEVAEDEYKIVGYVII